jgi:hypothetical protein
LGFSATSANTVINVFPVPVVSITPSSAAFCQGDSALLTANAVNGYTYQWMMNNNPVAGETSPNYYVSAAGNYSYVATTPVGCSGTSTVVVVNVNALPATPVITQNGNLLSAPAGYSYQWYLNGNLIVGAITQNYSATTSGNYTVEISDLNSCSSLSAPYAFTPTDISSAVSISSSTLYPNPNDGHFTITLGNNKTETVMELFDAQGQLLEQRMIQQNSTIDLSVYAKGFYFVRVDGVTHKLIIQ